MGLADCRRCKHFVPVEEMSDEEKEKAYIWIEKWRPGATLLGWCRAYNRPVTYYVGSCYRFSPRRDTRTRSILEFMKR